MQKYARMVRELFEMAMTKKACLISFVHEVTKVVKFSATSKSQFGFFICQDIVYRPGTPPWLHNVCWSTLDRSFNAKVFSCPCCTGDLGEENSKLVFCPDLVFLPVTPTCIHSVCRSSLCKRFRVEMFTTRARKKVSDIQV